MIDSSAACDDTTCRAHANNSYSPSWVVSTLLLTLYSAALMRLFDGSSSLFAVPRQIYSQEMVLLQAPRWRVLLGYISSQAAEESIKNPPSASLLVAGSNRRRIPRLVTPAVGPQEGQGLVGVWASARLKCVRHVDSNVDFYGLIIIMAFGFLTLQESFNNFGSECRCNIPIPFA